MGRSSIGFFVVALAAACNTGGGATGDGTTAAASSTGEALTSSTGGVGTTTVADTSTTAPATSGSSSSGAGDTHTIIYDVGTMVDAPPVDNTTGILVDWDCDALVQPFVSERELLAPRGYHDVVFDGSGNIIGWDGNALIASSYDDVTSVFLPGVSDVQGMDVLDNGDILWVGYEGVRRVTPDQVSSLVTGSVNGAYGITVGPDQMAYASTSGAIYRIDPESGEANVWLSTPGLTPRAMVFNLDSTGVYFSTLYGGNASVYSVAVDDELVPSGDPVVYANGVGEGYHDGLAIDACGNLYVPDYSSRGLYRVDTASVVTMLYNQATSGPSHYGHGLEFGSGIDGWDTHAIYLPQPYDNNTVNEVVLGVPSGALVRTWN